MFLWVLWAYIANYFYQTKFILPNEQQAKCWDTELIYEAAVAKSL